MIATVNAIVYIALASVLLGAATALYQWRPKRGDWTW